jgi:hypothetical protein
MQKMEWNKEKTEKKAIIVIEDTMQMCFGALDTKLEHQRCDLGVARAMTALTRTQRTNELTNKSMNLVPDTPLGALLFN